MTQNYIRVDVSALSSGPLNLSVYSVPCPTNELESHKKLSMGQYWRVINIDKRQQLGHWGKLGECLFDGSPGVLVDYLAVPFTAPTFPRFYQSPYEIRVNGEWAGDRIICVGDSAEDIPKGMLDASETQEFAQLTRREAFGEEASNGTENTQYDDSDIRLYDIASAYFEDPRSKLFKNASFARDEVWVLRNLTKHEYVRADAVIVHSDEMDGPLLARSAQGRRPGLGEALLSRISWSTGSSASMCYGYDGIGITRGVWAGDRFDIRTLDTVNGDSEEAGQWKDVSKEVAEEVFEIWTADFGESWREDGREK